jgi:hypothetical protein
MTIVELEDALVEFIAMNTSELRFRSNGESAAMVPPAVYAAFIPRNQVGDIEPGQITTYPAVIVRCKQGAQSTEYERVTVELLIGVYDDELDQQGSRDALNIVNRIKTRIREASIIRERFRVTMPLNWQINKRQSAGPTGRSNAFPYYFAEMQIDFELPVPETQYVADSWTPDYMPGRFNVPMTERPVNPLP